MSGYTWRGNGKLEDVNALIMAMREGRLPRPNSLAGRVQERSPCGTYAGYKRHMREQTPICGECKAAGARYRSQYRAGRKR